MPAPTAVIRDAGMMLPGNGIAAERIDNRAAAPTGRRETLRKIAGAFAQQSAG